MSNHVEIEKKFLIAYPDAAFLAAIPQALKSEITQTYLLAAPGVTARVRKRVYADGVRYYRTEKRRISAMSCYEDETELSRAAYEEALKQADPARRAICKTRCLVPSGPHTLELDLYPFWTDRAVLEVELASEEEAFRIPDTLHVLRDITDDKRYRNAALACRIPYDPLI